MKIVKEKHLFKAFRRNKPLHYFNTELKTFDGVNCPIKSITLGEAPSLYVVKFVSGKEELYQAI